MTLQVAERWFERQRIDDDITLLWEPFVDPLMRCNIWHIRGRERDLLVDTGMGVCSLREAARDLLEKDVLAFATHSHSDHVGGLHEFEQRVAHSSEVEELTKPPEEDSLRVANMNPAFKRYLDEVGYPMENELLITAMPHGGYDLDAWRTLAAAPTRTVEEGDVIDLGDRAFEVLHLPGHSPGSIGLWEAGTGTLFSGDAVYDGPLLDGLPESDLEDYKATMRRLRDLPVTVVHAGHDPSFGRERLVEIAEHYLEHGRFQPAS